METLSRGAEAIIYVDSGIVIKERVKKGYRIPELDEELRKTRTRREAKLLLEARRYGIPVPKIIEIEKFRIKMEYVSGKKLKYVFEECGEETRKKLAHELGELVGKLHAGGIVHGDLTTSNMILKDGEVYLIDFGLGFFSTRIEDFATDLLVFKESLRATHNKYLNEIWDNFIKGYLAEFREKKVLEQMEKIEKRGRYVKR